MKILMTSLMLGMLAIPLQAQSNDQSLSPRVEVAFVLDTTGSMGGLLHGAKQKIWSIANTIVATNPKADIHIALIGYRDFGDDYILRQHALTTDLEDLYGKLIQFQAEGGGDTPEAVNEALAEAVNELNWSDNATSRIIFLVGDAPPQMGYNGPKYPEILRNARQKGIIVNTVQAGAAADTKQIWTEMAQIGGGEYIQIPQNGGQIETVSTPFDNDIIQLQIQIDATIIPYGTPEMREAVAGKLSVKEDSSIFTRLANSAFYSTRETAREVITGGGDLLADVLNGTVNLSEIETQQLPELLQGQSDIAKEEFVASKIAERAILETEMRDLITKRADFMMNNTEVDPSESSFDKVVSDILTRQLK